MGAAITGSAGREKPFECDADGCGYATSRRDKLDAYRTRKHEVAELVARKSAGAGAGAGGGGGGRRGC